MMIVLFIAGGVLNLLLGLLFLFSLSILFVMYIFVALVSWWVARGIWYPSAPEWWTGLILCLLNLLPLDPVGSGWPLPTLTRWVLIFLRNYDTGWIVSAAMGLAGIVYFVFRRRRFGVRTPW